MHQFMIAAPHSGSGKTIVTAGLIRALRRRSLTVQPFKVGPDYIDPTYHTVAAGRTCRNLDAWMLGRTAVQHSFRYHAQAAAVAVVEGVMGLFDGYGSSAESSSADVAKTLGLPVFLLINARGMAHSAAALVHGYHTFDAALPLSGVILNNVGSDRHASLCKHAIEAQTGVPVVGHILRNSAFVLPERHLGLVPSAEFDPDPVIDAVADAVLQTIDLDQLLALSERPLAAPLAQPSAANQPESVARIAVAQDEAFSFTYPENLELLAQNGAEIIPFSPLHDAVLPVCDGVILCGGFPELYAPLLSQNSTMLASIRAFGTAGRPIIAECGGLMLLTDAIIDSANTRWEMVGLLAGDSRMTAKVTLGYRTITAVRDTPLLAQGASVRAHEFHYSAWDAAAHTPIFQIEPRTSSGQPRPTGATVHNVFASYMHVHYLARPQIAERIVAWMAA